MLVLLVKSYFMIYDQPTLINELMNFKELTAPNHLWTLFDLHLVFLVANSSVKLLYYLPAPDRNSATEMVCRQVTKLETCYQCQWSWDGGVLCITVSSTACKTVSGADSWRSIEFQLTKTEHWIGRIYSSAGPTGMQLYKRGKIDTIFVLFTDISWSPFVTAENSIELSTKMCDRRALW